MATDWTTWYNESLDALVEILEGTPGVSWGQDIDGNPWIVVGDRTSSGLEYPAAFIPTFSKVMREDDSSRGEEHHTIQAAIWIVDQGDVKSQEANLRDAINLGAAVEDHLYDNRSLNGTVRRLDVTESTPASAVIDGDSLQTVELQLRCIKDALH